MKTIKMTIIAIFWPKLGPDFASKYPSKQGIQICSFIKQNDEKDKNLYLHQLYDFKNAELK